ncbi:hypothetical protein BD311DRAFT_742997 [Dichomitus squalens]|uniref:Uncharacterized protein n=1 Tax=Dichomitus squalens TaxID=114155 RepID=A0A4Q9M647_9APHY|nr:hypothetical protein BD311DRAFT_742997 [Dichomitus squalens]
MGVRTLSVSMSTTPASPSTETAMSSTTTAHAVAHADHTMHMARILLLTSGYRVIAALSAFHDDADDLMVRRFNAGLARELWAATHATGLVEAVEISAVRAAGPRGANPPPCCAPISTLLASTEWDGRYLQVDIRKLDRRAIINSLPLTPHQAVALAADPWMPMHWDDLSHLQLNDNTFKKAFQTALSFAEKSTQNVRAADKVLMSSLEALDRELFPKEK